MQVFRQAMAAHRDGNLNQAEILYRRALAAEPRQFPALQMLGILHAQRGEFAKAEELLRRALEINPKDAGPLFNYGNVLLRLEKLDLAFEAFGDALMLNPGLADAELNRGNIQMLRKRFGDALACFDRAIRTRPDYAEAHCNRGNALEEIRRFEDALASYDKALSINPHNAEFHASRANVLQRLKRSEEALQSLSLAIGQQPQNAGFHYNRGNILFGLKRYAEAFAAYDRSFSFDPCAEYVEGDRYFAKAMICDWANFSEEAERLNAGISAGRAVSRPFGFLTARSTPLLQVRCAEGFADREFPAMPALSRGERYNHERIRVAYLSADFREHPVSSLLAGMFECHDHRRFETIAFSFGDPKPSPMRQRLERAFDRFVDAEDRSDAEIAGMLREVEVDIAVDLMGPTEAARPGIFSYRPAPLQVMYLGYAGSSGASFIDYLVADRLVLPEIESGLFREKIIYLPDTFMGTDSKRAISATMPSRADEMLPEGAFVFCSFSNTYKISPEIFDVWMDLLREIEGSVLWLSGGNEAATINLRREAQIRGVAPERLIFARRVDRNEDHLARHRLADLFLDTSPLGAHSTVCDALWAGLPVLTCTGTTFGGRVATSLLFALGLEELVVDSSHAYKERALTLARNPELLASVKARLATNRLKFPLFNTERFTRHLEMGLISIWERHQRGEAPTVMHIPALRS
jgi:protein O-GlcNAc transferase